MHDVFIHNAVIHDGERFTDADALLVKAGRISWIGPGACAPAHDGVPSVDLEGRTVLPALCDVHTHPSWIAATVRSVPCVSPIVNTIEEMIEALRRHPLAGRGPEAWITGFGYDEGKLAEHRTPTIEDLDRVSTTQPVFVKRSDCHSAICNSVALRLAGIEAGTPDPAGGIGRTCLNASEAQGDAVADRRVAVGALHEHGLRRADAVEVLDGGGAVFGELAFVIAEARDPGLGPSAGERMAPERLNHLLDRVDDRGDAGHGPHRGRNPARMGVNVAERGQNRSSLEVDGRHAVVRGCAGAGTDPGDAARLDEKGVRVGEAFAVVNDGIVNEDVVHGSPALKLKAIQKGYGCRGGRRPKSCGLLCAVMWDREKRGGGGRGRGREKGKKYSVGTRAPAPIAFGVPTVMVLVYKTKKIFRPKGKIL